MVEAEGGEGAAASMGSIVEGDTTGAIVGMSLPASSGTVALLGAGVSTGTTGAATGVIVPGSPATTGAIVGVPLAAVAPTVGVGEATSGGLQQTWTYAGKLHASVDK